MFCNNETALSYVSKGREGIIWDREKDYGSQKGKRVIITFLSMLSFYHVAQPNSTDNQKCAFDKISQFQRRGMAEQNRFGVSIWETTCHLGPAVNWQNDPGQVCFADY